MNDTTRNYEYTASGTRIPFLELVSPAHYVGVELTDGAARGLSGIRKLIARFLEWYAIRATIVVLSRLDDRTLADIGIERSEIPAAARRAAGHPDAPHRRSSKG